MRDYINLYHVHKCVVLNFLIKSRIVFKVWDLYFLTYFSAHMTDHARTYDRPCTHTWQTMYAHMADHARTPGPSVLTHKPTPTAENKQETIPVTPASAVHVTWEIASPCTGDIANIIHMFSSAREIRPRKTEISQYAQI